MRRAPPGCTLPRLAAARPTECVEQHGGQVGGGLGLVHLHQRLWGRKGGGRGAMAQSGAESRGWEEGSGAGGGRTALHRAQGRRAGPQQRKSAARTRTLVDCTRARRAPPTWERIELPGACSSERRRPSPPCPPPPPSSGGPEKVPTVCARPLFLLSQTYRRNSPVTGALPGLAIARLPRLSTAN